MQAFSTTPPAYQASSPGTASAALIYSGTGVTVAGTAYPFPPASQQAQVIVQNSGTATAFVGGGSTVSAATGIPVPGGQSAVIPATVGTASTFALWAIASGAPTSIEASLASVVADV